MRFLARFSTLVLPIVGSVAFGQFHLIASPAGKTACMVTPSADLNTLKVSLPANIASTVVKEWRLEGVAVPGQEHSVTLTFDPWKSGPYRIQAVSGLEQTLCEATVARKPMDVVATVAGASASKSQVEPSPSQTERQWMRRSEPENGVDELQAQLEVTKTKAATDRKQATQLAELAREQAGTNSSTAAVPTVTAAQDSATKAQQAAARADADDKQVAELQKQLVAAESRIAMNSASASSAMSADSYSSDYPTERKPQPRTPMSMTTQVTVYFATEREPLPGPAIRFANVRDASRKLRFGVASVLVPADAKPLLFPGSHLYRFFASPAAPPRSMQMRTRLATSADFYQQIRTQLRANAQAGEVLVYIHGFNNGFDEEIWRAAKLSRDIGLQGAPIVYDWPSSDGALNYIADLHAMEGSVKSLAEFLAAIKANTGASQVDILAHSMGNFGLLRALEKLSDEGRLPQINNIIMAAPDVTPLQAEQDIPALLATGKIGAMTLYASSKDFAMRVSSHYNNKVAPIGELPPVTLFPSLVTVDASAVSLDGFGHDYFVSSREVEQDIGYVIRNRSVPRKLSRVNSGEKMYWQIMPE